MSAFASHRPLGPGVFIEVNGLDFEDFEVGQTFEHRPGRTFTALENTLHALRSLDLTPPETISEVFVLGVVTALTTKTFGKVVANLGWKDVRFPRPVRPGDTIHAESEILGARASRSRPTQGILHVRTRALDQHGEEVCTFERHFLVYRRGQGPHAEAGY